MPALQLVEAADASLAIEGAGAPVRMDALHPRILRLGIGERAQGERETYLDAQPPAIPGTLSRRGPADAIAGDFSLHLDAHDCSLELRDGSNARLVRLDLASLCRGADRRLGFEAVGEQHFYGQGHGGGGLDRLGTTRRLWNCHVNHGPGADIAIPLLISSAGYGLFFDNPALAFLDPGRSVDTICFDYVTPCPTFDLCVLVGGSIAGVLELVAHLLGAPAMPPRWALGYLQSTRHFEDRDELRRLLTSFASRQCPCDALILLSSYGEALGWNRGVGHLEVQPALFADAADLVDEIRQAGLRVITHEYPVLHEESGLHAVAQEKGYLLEAAYPDLPAGERTAISYHEGQRYIDFGRPEVGDWWWDCHRPLADAGVDGWWLDGGEGPAEDSDPGAGHNRYDLMRQAAFAAGEARDRPGRRPFLLCRSGGPGMQRTGAACWSGDVNASFTSLEMQLALGLSTGLSGVPFWGTDIGGYYPTDPADPELFVRWFQFAAFTPIFRGHGRRWREHLPWSHGEEALAICRRYLELRYRLLPYTYSLCRQAHLHGLPLMRPLLMAFPEDPNVRDLANPYLWGPDLLVSPVTRAVVDSWPVYLPEGRWYDFWTGGEFDGGRSVAVPAPLERMPLFARAGAILPLGPSPLRPDHRPAPTLDLVVYPGGESRFTLYEDDGETQAWRDGAYAETVIACTVRADEIVVAIEPAAGDPAIIPAERRWRLRIRVPSPPAGVTTGRSRAPEWRMEGSWVVVEPIRGPVEVRLHLVSADPHRTRRARPSRPRKSKDDRMSESNRTPAGAAATADRTALRAFDYEGVTLLPGRFRRQVELAVETYGSLPDDSILHGFRRHAGMPAPGEPMRGWCAGSSSVIFGQLLSGLVRLGKATGDAALVQKAIRLFEGWRQTLSAPGHAGMRPYDWEKLVCGLVDLYAFAGHGPALSTLADTTDWAAATFDRSCAAADVHDFWGAGPGDTQEWYTLPESLYRAYALTGDARFRSFADLWLYEDYWRPFAETASLGRVVPVHAYSHVNSFSSAAMAYVVSGDERYRRICENAYDFLQETQCYATGGYGPDERLMPPDGSLGRSLDRLCYHAEIPCGAWAGFKLARYLMTFTGEARFGDWMETLLLNGMGAALPTRADGQTYYYGEYGIAAGRKQFYWHEWPCCSGTYLQCMAEYHNLVFFEDAEDLCVNLYLPAELRWDREGAPITVRLETDYPEAPSARVTLDMAEPAEFRLRFRIPGWCRGASLQVNGEPVDVAAAPGRWAALKRLWKSGDRITIALPMSLRTVPVDRQHPDRVAVMYGPVVLAQDEACCRRPLAIGRATKLSSRLVHDGPGLRFRLINTMPERHTRHLVPLYDLPAFWPYWIYFDLHAEALY